MNAFGFLFTTLNAVLLLALPRRWAALPLLIGATFVTLHQAVEIGPANFSVIRLLIAVGFVRVFLRGECLSARLTFLDKIMIGWALWACFSLAFHQSNVFVLRIGQTYDILGSYFLFRLLICNIDDVRHIFQMTCILLIPLALMMLVERFKGFNPLGLVDFGPLSPEFRNSYFRAQGAFGHSILAGTVGAVSLPMALALWPTAPRLALIGLATTTTIVYCSGSSGPIMAALSVIIAMAFWPFRWHLRLFRWLAVLLIFALSLAMSDPVYFLMARIDITGGSTGYFRAQLIRSAIEHLGEWWATGTDFTRHWMATGITANSNHTDMTNHYLAIGVWGGLPLLFLFIGTLFAAFTAIGKALRETAEFQQDQFLLWALGSVLVGHMISFMSISYFDQTFVYFYLCLACTASVTTSLDSVQHEQFPPRI